MFISRCLSFTKTRIRLGTFKHKYTTQSTAVTQTQLHNANKEAFSSFLILSTSPSRLVACTTGRTRTKGVQKQGAEKDVARNHS
jgi:hypothetical protein